jgi:hypothetical protein
MRKKDVFTVTRYMLWRNLSDNVVDLKGIKIQVICSREQA